MIDLAISHRARAYDLEHGVGEMWWLSVLKALTGSGSKDGAQSDDEVRWL